MKEKVESGCAQVEQRWIESTEIWRKEAEKWKKHEKIRRQIGTKWEKMEDRWQKHIYRMEQVQGKAGRK